MGRAKIMLRTEAIMKLEYYEGREALKKFEDSMKKLF